MWKKLSESKRNQVFNQIPKDWVIEPPSVEEEKNAIVYLDGILPKEENYITSLSLLELRSKIIEKEFTSLEVIKAFAHRAALTHQLCNNLSEIFFEKAFERAKELDEYYSRTGELIGPLHGLPVSLKDQVNLEGIDSAIGIVGLANNPKTKEEESVIANILYDAGAVFYLKTTVPFALMAADTVSNLCGQSLNPINRKLSPGGSSGCEGSLIAAKGSVIGLSTDIGGSIRVPAAFNGIFGLKPTTGRLPYCKVTNSWPDQNICPSVIGPHAKYLDDLKFFVKVILDSKPWLYDPKVSPIPWRDGELPKNPTFGIMKNNGFITPHPPIVRALEEIKSSLEKQGYEVIEWDPPISHREGQLNLTAIFGVDGNKWGHEHFNLTDEPKIPQLLGINEVLKEMTITEVWEIESKKYKSQQIYDKYWLETAKLTKSGRPIDGWISPTWETTSFPAGVKAKEYLGTYTEIINYLNYPSLVVPITKVDKNIDKYEDFKPLNNFDQDNKEGYDSELLHGMPVTVQIVTQRFEEEKAIALGDIIYKVTH